MRKCNCDQPPGGGTSCPPDSLAICRLENGECRGYCWPIPSSLTTLELENWVLRVVKEDNRSLHESISFDDRRVLDKKQFITTTASGAQVIIRFDFPDTDETGEFEMAGSPGTHPGTRRR
jgi:hypothetical protein